MLRGGIALACRIVGPPDLHGLARDVYYRHLVFALCDAVAGGVLANAPVMAIKELGARDWQLAVPMFLSSFGMLLAPWMAEWMAARRKVWFVSGPALGYGVCAIALGVIGSPVAFLALVGLCNLFEVISRPPLAAVIREAYPVDRRGWAVGDIRRWCAAVFLAVNLLSAAALDWAGTDRRAVMTAEVLLAGGFCIIGALVFRGVRTAPPGPVSEPIDQVGIAGLAAATQIVRSDARFRRYLIGCFLFGFFGLLYVSFIPAFLAKTMGFGYLTLSILIHVLPSIASVAATGALGRWFDRTNPLVGWQLVRFGWGIDPIILISAPLAAAIWAPAGLLVCAFGRLCRGAVMGGSWVLWWQLGVNYFALPGANTGRYMAILTALNGVMRMTAAAVGAALLTGMTPADVLGIGGVGVLLSALHARLQAHSDHRLTGFRTFADTEAATSAPVRKE
jgi:MFS family permease